MSTCSMGNHKGTNKGKIYYSFLVHKLFSKQKRWHRRITGIADLLYIDQLIVKESKDWRQNAQDIPQKHKTHKKSREKLESGIYSRRKT